MNTLPDAVQREYEGMVHRTIDVLRTEGYDELHVDGIAGYPTPEPITVRVLNAPIEPDITARATGKGTLIGFVEVSTNLSIEETGRRWQWVQDHWIPSHGGRLAIFVHPEDAEQAQRIARCWKLDERLVHALDS